MDREKVIKHFEHLLNAAKGNYQDFVDLTVDVGEEILALLKQEAVEPILIGKEGNPFSFFVCGDCGEPLYGRMNISYCAHCGRAVRWDA